MEVTVYGTRGSTPGQPRGSQRYGGNTTCLRVESPCLPKNFALAIDAGSGFVDLSKDVAKEKIFNLGVIFTHYHHDHTQGLFLAPHTYMGKHVPVWGPYEHNEGPEEVLEKLMRRPLFPVEFEGVKDRFDCKPLRHVGTQVLIFHPEAGHQLVKLAAYQRALRNGRRLSSRNGEFKIDECLVVKMYLTSHPEYTVSYRFEEMPTKRTFVFLTDHEVTAGFPRDLIAHLHGAHLLIQDGQYSQERYNNETAGFGHGTPEYCAATAAAAGVERLGITHHDPGATDADIEDRVSEAQRHAEERGKPELVEHIFACADYSKYQV